jgi:hypothetical protein
MPVAWYRSRHDNTVVTVASTNSAIRVLAVPWAANNTIRARFAADAGTVDARVHRSSSSRSPGRNTKAGAGRFAMPQSFNNQPTKDLRHAALVTLEGVVLRSGSSMYFERAEIGGPVSLNNAKVESGASLSFLDATFVAGSVCNKGMEV